MHYPELPKVTLCIVHLDGVTTMCVLIRCSWVLLSGIWAYHPNSLNKYSPGLSAMCCKANRSINT